MRTAVLLIAGVLIAGCETAPKPTPEPIVTTHDVPIVIPVACTKSVKELPAAPEYPDTDEALASAPDIFSAVKLLKAGRKLRIARENSLSTALAACAGTETPTN